MQHFHVFGSPCFVLKDRIYKQKFEARISEGIFLRYSMNSESDMVYLLSSKVVIESNNGVVKDKEYIRPEEEEDLTIQTGLELFVTEGDAIESKDTRDEKNMWS